MVSGTPEDSRFPREGVVDAASALTLAAAEEPLLVVLDLLLPDMAGWRCAASCAWGVRVRLILPAPSDVDGDAAGIAMIIRAGARVYRAEGLYIHAKAIVADGKRAFVGSQNFSPASLDHNRALGVIINDRDAIATLEQTFASDWNAA